MDSVEQQRAKSSAADVPARAVHLRRIWEALPHGVCAFAPRPKPV